MGVRLTSHAEHEQVMARKKAREQATWEIYRSISLVDIVRKARDMGWGDNKVQVRQERLGSDITEYVIEPYEGKGCNCPGILNFPDFFLRPDEK